MQNRPISEFHIPIKPLTIKNKSLNCIPNPNFYIRNKENLNTINTQFPIYNITPLVNGNLPTANYSIYQKNYRNISKEKLTTSVPFIKKRAESFRKLKTNNNNSKKKDSLNIIIDNNLNINKNNKVTVANDPNTITQLFQRKSKVIIFPSRNNINNNNYYDNLNNEDNNITNSSKSVLLNMNTSNTNSQSKYEIKSKKISFVKNNCININDNNKLKFEAVKRCLEDKFSDENNPTINKTTIISNNSDHYLNNLNSKNEISQEQEKLKLIKEKKKLLLQQEKERKKKFLELLLQEEKNFELNEQKFKQELQQQEKTEKEIKQKINKLKQNISNNENNLITISEIFPKNSIIPKIDNISEASANTDRTSENTKNEIIKQKLCIPKKFINKKIIPYHKQSFSKGNEELLIIDKINKVNDTKNKPLIQKIKHKSKKSNSVNNINVSLSKNKNRKNLNLFKKRLERYKSINNDKENHTKKLNNTVKNRTCDNEILKYLISTFKNNKLLFSNATNSHKNKFEEYVNPSYCNKKIKFPDISKILQDKKNKNTDNNIKTLPENLFQCKSSDNIKKETKNN